MPVTPEVANRKLSLTRAELLFTSASLVAIFSGHWLLKRIRSEGSSIEGTLPEQIGQVARRFPLEFTGTVVGLGIINNDVIHPRKPLNRRAFLARTFYTSAVVSVPIATNQIDSIK